MTAKALASLLHRRRPDKRLLTTTEQAAAKRSGLIAAYVHKQSLILRGAVNAQLPCRSGQMVYISGGRAIEIPLEEGAPNGDGPVELWRLRTDTPYEGFALIGAYSRVYCRGLVLAVGAS